MIYLWVLAYTGLVFITYHLIKFINNVTRHYEFVKAFHESRPDYKLDSRLTRLEYREDDNRIKVLEHLSHYPIPPKNRKIKDGKEVK